MGEYSIGFRMKFDNVKSEDISKVLLDYLKYFDRYEIKVTSNIISSNKIITLLKVSEKLARGKYSLHLPKDVLSNEQSYAETKKVIEILHNYRGAQKIYLVTHIPYGNFRKYLKCILSISMKLPKNCILLLENEKVNNDSYEYLLQINKVCTLLHKKNISNVGICLDFGHLLFGFYKEGTNPKCGLEQLNQMPYIIHMVKQIHIHDYYNTDHLQLGKGIMDLNNILRYVIEKNLIVPIIIETTVKDPKCDGIEQVLLIRHKLQKLKEMI